MHIKERGWGKKLQAWMQVRNWMCKSGSSSISATPNPFYTDCTLWTNATELDRTLSIRKKQTWGVGLFHLNKHKYTWTYTHRQRQSYFFPGSFHFSSFLHISFHIRVNGKKWKCACQSGSPGADIRSEASPTAEMKTHPDTDDSGRLSVGQSADRKSISQSVESQDFSGSVS